MNDDQIIAMAKESELVEFTNPECTESEVTWIFGREELIDFARSIAAVQKEKDAQICENAKDYFREKDGHKFPALKDFADDGAGYCADAIRSEKP